MGNFYVQTLEFAIAVSSILSIRCLARGNITGWIWEIITSILAGIFFMLRGHNILMIVEVLNVPFAFYGYTKWKRNAEKITSMDRLMVYTAIIVIIGYFFCDGISIGALQQTTTSSIFLIGGLLIAREKKFGWYMYIMADIFLAYILLKSNDYIFVGFQFISIGIAVHKVTILKNLKINMTHKSCLLFYKPL